MRPSTSGIMASPCLAKGPREKHNMVSDPTPIDLLFHRWNNIFRNPHESESDGMEWVCCTLEDRLKQNMQLLYFEWSPLWQFSLTYSFWHTFWYCFRRIFLARKRKRGWNLEKVSRFHQSYPLLLFLLLAVVSGILSCNLGGNMFLHSIWHVFWHSARHIFWDSFWRLRSGGTCWHLELARRRRRRRGDGHREAKCSHKIYITTLTWQVEEIKEAC